MCMVGIPTPVTIPYAHTVECGHEETATLRNRGVRLAKND